VFEDSDVTPAAAKKGKVASSHAHPTYRFDGVFAFGPAL
jgi:hypothetical protein